jgi:hypothetical protein
MLALAQVAFAAGAQQQRKPGQPKSTRANSPVTEDLSQGASFTLRIAPNLPEFSFKVIPEPVPTDQWGNAHSTVRDVEVFRADSDAPLQHLTGCDWSASETPPANSDWFRAEDFNFDGYKDIYVMTNWGATGNQYGCVWLYDPATGRFDYNKQFSELPRYWLDPDTKTILTFQNGGQAGMVHQARKYNVENNRLVLIWSEDQDLDQEKNQFHCTVKERQGGNLLTVRDEWISPEDGEGPCVPAKFIPHPPARKGPN